MLSAWSNINLYMEVESSQSGCAGCWKGTGERHWSWKPDWLAEWGGGRMQALSLLSEDGERMPFPARKTNCRPDTLQPASHEKGSRLLVTQEAQIHGSNPDSASRAKILLSLSCAVDPSAECSWEHLPLVGVRVRGSWVCAGC